MESLINAGALDCFGRDRAAMSAGMDQIMGFAQRTQENAASGQSDIFGLSGAPKEQLILPQAAPGCRQKSCTANSRR